LSTELIDNREVACRELDEELQALLAGAETAPDT